LARQYVNYVKATTEMTVNKSVAKINTDFPLDHSTLPAMLASVTNPNVPWLLGSIEEGWEWFAFTFHDQKEIDLARKKSKSC
jgi:hypothetical protein